MTKKKRLIISFSGILVVCAVSFSAIHFAKKYCYQKDILKAAEEGKRGFWALAAEKVDRHRFDMLSNENDCNTLLNVYANAKKAERLEWAAQACLEDGIETYGAYMSLVMSQELLGRDQEALQLMDQISKKFDKAVTVFQRMANAYLRQKDEARATEAMLMAASRSQDPQVKLDTLQILLKQNRNEEAMNLALTLKGVATENPEVKLIIARALIAGKEATGGSAQINEAKFLMMKLDPAKRQQIESQFADVIGEKKISRKR